MPDNKHDSRQSSQPDDSMASSFREAMRTVSHVTTSVCIMLLCGGIGYGLDQYFDTRILGFFGFAGGAFLGIRYLIARTSGHSDEEPGERPSNPSADRP